MSENPETPENPENGGRPEEAGAPVPAAPAVKGRPRIIAVLPVYDRPILPSEVIPVQLSAKWAETVRRVINSDDKMMAVIARPEQELESELDLGELAATMGCAVRIIQARIGEELQVVVQGVARVRVNNPVRDESGCIAGEATYPEDELPAPDEKQTMEIKAHAMAILATMHELIPINPLYFQELKQYLLRFNPNDPSMLADCAASITTAGAAELMSVLETVKLLPRLKIALRLIERELETTKLERSIKNAVSEKINADQRKFFLREQLQEIQKELGIQYDDNTSELNRLREKMSKLKPPPAVAEKFESELSRLAMLDSRSAEFSVCRDYLNWLTDVPWGRYANEEGDFSLAKAREILEEDHEGLKDVKERILEFLAVGIYKGGFTGAVILLVGPPGVGKTSIGKSIARALNRPFFRFSVGGLRDEAEIKGHMRTYVSALPGKMIQALKETKAMNPVIVLDEIDKLTNDSHRGDPASALLEALDPEQNSGFLDHYLDVPVDLSRCLFVCTANYPEGIPAPLMDRMDAIRLPGYLAEEKFLIAKKHLVPKNKLKAGVMGNEVRFQDGALRKIIEEYSREAGVRGLEKNIAKIIRMCLVRIIDAGADAPPSVVVKPSDVREYLGVPVYAIEKTLKGVGVVTGLAWTAAGGATLPVEAALVDRYARGFSLTGNLGSVMKESAGIALSYVAANLAGIAPGADRGYFEKANIHLHVPEGAVPKDGPSAGITMASAILSLALNRAPRGGFAMTGELSLTGHVLPVGGIREKVIAAKRAGIGKIILPLGNRPDVEDLPDYVKKDVEFSFVDLYPEAARILFGGD